ncbi:MAG: HAMP domain-containing sensor histidine kinase [Acidobacteriota bacterium]
MYNRNTYSLTRSFGNLKVRVKLIVLHNLFFLVLASSVYFSLIPLFEQQVAGGRPTEVAMLDPSYIEAVSQARTTLFLVLGAIYVGAVVLLEAAIMPLYVYRPLRLMLDADTATRAGDRQREMIPTFEIPDDEIGQIMQSRNETVEELRGREDELATALRRIEDQDRLVSLGLLSASVAHELNTPLAVLHGSVEKLIETTKDPQTLERLARVERVTQRLRTISESLIDFARVRSQRSEPVPVATLVADAWDLVAIDARAAGLTFTNHVPLDVQVVGNPDRLAQVFVNLLRNAMNAFDAPGGHVDVRSRSMRRGGKEGVAIAVEDNGPGIPAEVLPDIFDAFVTTRLDSRGTGLGLTVAQGIATQHGGTITASNRKEGGARLEVWLPAVAA